MAVQYGAPQTPEERARNRQQARFWGAVVGVFFLVTFFANFMLAYLSLGTWTGLTSQHAYDEGNNYNKALEGAEAVAARGWQVTIGFTAGTGQTGQLVVSLKDRQGAPLTGATVSATFLRPTSEGHDVTVTLDDSDGSGRYSSDVTLPLAGVYDVHVAAQHPAGDYQGSKRIWVP
ncbi:MAG: FixH family protein [Azospirillaceae bacterium]|nr:FixH family protein [Azospirillaceae bacterium]